MTVFLAHAPADRQTAEALEKIIERRGQFCELDDGQTALRPVGNGDAFVLLVSQALTLFITPVLYTYMEDLARLLRAAFRRQAPATPAGAGTAA